PRGRCCATRSGPPRWARGRGRPSWRSTPGTPAPRASWRTCRRGRRRRR
ncbi:MAG: hypothetical protein AVDCRST_MAG08-3642, partial [uncultured Acetobacteraceae bacterium]